MIKELRRRLMLVMLISFTVIVISLVSVIVVVPDSQKRREIRQTLESLSEGSSSPNAPSPAKVSDTPPAKPELEPSDTTPPIVPSESGNLPSSAFRFSNESTLTIETDSSGAMTKWTSARSDYNDETVSAILLSIQKSGDEFNYADGYYYLRHTTPDGYSYIVLDASSSINDFRRTLMWGLIGGLSSWILLFLLSIKLSSMMVEPVEEAFEKQTQFISDASHELKTPIAVIQANADVLKNETGDSKWLEYIITETHRMDGLVKDLLFLTSVNKTSFSPSHINFSRLVAGAVLPFEALAFESGREIECSITEDIYIKGVEKEMEKLISILLSNALKYSYDNSKIRVTLLEKSKTAVLKVYNEGIGVKKEDRDKIFERFYRVDKARSRESGSYGLGLAMAKTIALNHNASISVESEYGRWIEFSFEIKLD